MGCGDSGDPPQFRRFVAAQETEIENVCFHGPGDLRGPWWLPARPWWLPAFLMSDVPAIIALRSVIAPCIPAWFTVTIALALTLALARPWCWGGPVCCDVPDTPATETATITSQSPHLQSLVGPVVILVVVVLGVLVLLIVLGTAGRLAHIHRDWAPDGSQAPPRVAEHHDTVPDSIVHLPVAELPAAASCRPRGSILTKMPVRILSVRNSW